MLTVLQFSLSSLSLQVHMHRCKLTHRHICMGLSDQSAETVLPSVGVQDHPATAKASVLQTSLLNVPAFSHGIAQTLKTPSRCHTHGSSKASLAKRAKIAVRLWRASLVELRVARCTLWMMCHGAPESQCKHVMVLRCCGFVTRFMAGFLQMAMPVACDSQQCQLHPPIREDLAKHSCS